MCFLLFGEKLWAIVLYAAVCYWVSAQGHLLRALQLSTAKPCCSHHRKPRPLHSGANKDTGISLPPYSRRVHLYVVQKRHITTEQYFASQPNDHLGSAVHVLFSSHPWESFLLDSTWAISCSFECPLLATTACVLVAKEEKLPFKGLGLSLLAMTMLHSLLSSTRFLRYCYSTPLSTGIIKNKTAFSPASPYHFYPSPFLPLLSKSQDQKHRKFISCTAVGGGGEEWDDAPASQAWHVAAEPEPRKGQRFKAVHGKITSSLSPVANLAITAQHLPHFRARQHLHSVSSDTPASCANTATCRSRVPTPSQSAGSWLEWGAPWSASSGLHSCFTLLTALHSRTETPPPPTPPHCTVQRNTKPLVHLQTSTSANPESLTRTDSHNQELRRVESPARDAGYWRWEGQ
jgi:hypothetical protein